MLRRDDLMNGYYIYQDTDCFCFGIDAVLLAHYPAIRKGDRVLDMGTGFAPVPLILSARARDAGLAGDEGGIAITGLELQARPAELARRSVRENALENMIRIEEGDIREAGRHFAPASFSLITCNPPYMPSGSGLVSANRARAIARTELCCTLEDVVGVAGRLLKMSGRFAMIHRPERLPEIFALLAAHGLAPKRMRLVCPRADKAPTMLLVEAVKGGGPSLKIDAPLIVYTEDGQYTEEIYAIYGWDAVSGRDADRKS